MYQKYFIYFIHQIYFKLNYLIQINFHKFNLFNYHFNYDLQFARFYLSITKKYYQFISFIMLKIYFYFVFIIIP